MTQGERLICVALLGEGVDLWRPVRAEHVGDALFRILPQPYDRGAERWEFEPGTDVLCRFTETSDGTIFAARKRASESLVARAIRRLVGGVRARRRRDHTVTIEVGNHSGRATQLVLEPLGEVYPLPAGTTKTVRFVISERAPKLTISIGDDELALWEETESILEADLD